jgi:proline racemase
VTSVGTVDHHAAGEPFRIAAGGVEPLRGATVLEKRRAAFERLDHVRRLLVCARGHADIYRCHVVPPDDAGADPGVVFSHNAGYSTSCGHGTIALVTEVDGRAFRTATPEFTLDDHDPHGEGFLLR